MLVLPPEKRMGKAPPDDFDSNRFDVVIAKETGEYQERALPPEKNAQVGDTRMVKSSNSRKLYMDRVSTSDHLC